MNWRWKFRNLTKRRKDIYRLMNIVQLNIRINAAIFANIYFVFQADLSCNYENKTIHC
jgi:hypothetical protein